MHSKSVVDICCRIMFLMCCLNGSAKMTYKIILVDKELLVDVVIILHSKMLVTTITPSNLSFLCDLLPVMLQLEVNLTSMMISLCSREKGANEEYLNLEELY